MFTFLDLLIVVVMAMAAASLLALVLMFTVKNKTFQRVCLYLVAALGAYVSTVGFQINWLGFEGQAILAVVLGLVCVGAVVLERVKKHDDKMFLIARMAASAGLVLGMANAFFV